MVALPAVRLLDFTLASTVLMVAILTMRPCAISASFANRHHISFVCRQSVLRDSMKAVRSQNLFSKSISTSVLLRPHHLSASTTRLMSTSTGNNKPPEIVHINREQMEEIIEDYETGGREESQYCVIDVRTEEEVQSTGKISDNVYTLPVQVIMQSNVFAMDPEEFEEFCQFPKPSFDETIVFTCAAGMRSVSACHFATKAGYTKIINYTGGANEWFSPSRF